MIVVVVRQHRDVHLLEADAQPGGVVGEGARSAGVEQDPVVPPLEEEGQPELGDQPPRVRGAEFSTRVVTFTAV